MTQSKPIKPKTAELPISGRQGQEATGRKSGADEEIAALKSQFDNGGPVRVRKLTNNQALADFFTIPDDMERSIADMVKDLSEVPVVDAYCAMTNPFRKIDCSPNISPTDRQLIWKCLAVVREAFKRADGCAEDGLQRGYQWNMNWKHTRAEIDQVLEAAKLLRLDPQSTAEAILASIFSDSVKNRRNFIVHNIDGAYGAAQVLCKFLNPSNARDLKRIERVARAVREHQVAPPEFMARAATIMISKKLKLPRFDIRGGFAARASIPIDADETDEHVIKWNLSSIYKKISDPFNKAHLTADLLRIDFTPAERNLLKNIGVSEWYVPHPDKPDARIAHAVIAGDHSINYNHPDGFAKIALIRGPDTEALFEDPTVLDSLDSAVASFADSFRVLLPEVQPMAIAGLRRTQAAVERVTAIMRELFSGVIIGTREICISGAQKVAEAIERAHERHPELFIVDTTEAFQASEKSTEKAVENVALILQEWLDSHGGTLPFNPKSSIPAEPGSAKLPFWNAPLVYPERDSNGILNLDTLSELQRNQFHFAGRIRDIAVELLRAEQWIY